MFQKLAREHPTLKNHWYELLEKGCIENSRGKISLTRKYAKDENVLVIEDVVNDITYSIRIGKLVIIRGVSSHSPSSYTFLVGNMGKLDLDDMHDAFDCYEGFENAVRDLYRSISAIVKEHQKSKSLMFRANEWFKCKINKFFFLLTVVYTIITILLMYNYIIK